MPRGDARFTAENRIAGKIVLALRLSLDLTQPKFCDYLRANLRMDHQPSTISRWEDGSIEVPGALVAYTLRKLGPQAIAVVLAEALQTRRQSLTVPYSSAQRFAA